MTDWQLLQEYVQTRSEEAFAEMVRRHIDWVASAARRQVRDEHLAEDVTQAVFVAMAQQAGKLHGGTALSTWLFQVTRYASIHALRDEARRRRREQEGAAMRRESSEAMTQEQWQELAPVLDELVARLGEKDRVAVLLRFYQGKSLGEVGEAMGISEEAARKRVGRAVERLRERMKGKGLVATPAGALVVGLGVHVSQPVGASLVVAATEAGLAVSRGAAVSGQIAGIVKGALKMIVYAKAKLMAAVTVVGLLAVGTGAVVTPMVWGQQKQEVAGTPQAAPAKVNAAKADTLEFGAELPDGLRLEVVGVSHAPSKGQAWWKPDGSPLAERPYEAMPGAMMIGQGVLREIAVRIANQPAEPATVNWDVDSGGGASGGLVRPRLPDMHGRMVLWADGTTTASVVFHVAAGPWQTVHVNRSIGPGGMGSTSNVTGGVFIIDRPMDQGGETKITIVDGMADYDCRIVAVDEHGGEHVGETRSSSTGVTRLSVATFPELEQSQIKEVRFQTRPFDTTVRVDNISLVPGQKTQVKVETRLPAPARAETATPKAAAVSAEQVAEEMVGLLGGVTETLKGVRDEATARAAVAKLEESAKGLRQVRAKAAGLGDMPPETQRAVAEKYQTRMMKLMAALAAEVNRIRQDDREYAIVREALMQIQQGMGG